jgi:2-desacetyl-2-hydroxyethyl bacteriochlorophyllide A dehydrogenase
MKTITLNEPGKFDLSETSEPVDVPPGQALVRVRRVGICGTDWHAYHGRQPFFTYPRILGHELGVEVERVNDSSSSLRPGDRCSVEPYLNCGRCIACRRGKGNCCVDLKVLGVHIDGGMREHIIVPTSKLHRSNSLSLEQLALVETLAIGCHAVQRAQLERGESVLIVGAGPIGLSIIPFAKAAGADVTVMDVSATRLSFCRGAMPVRTMDASEEFAEFPTAVFDATGNPNSMMRGFDRVAHGGCLVFVGLFQGDVTFNDPNFHRREITLLASRNALPADFERIIKLLEAGEIDTQPWITHRSTADRLIETLPSWLSPDAGVIKAMIEF